ncbi:outer membrane protein assembly factor BamA [Rhodosalinus sp.]|uniref:outer membrane protein assembly factor BamA n=1 Tax=Rhodosalinus sp. TaxID=2047741 RepID=UPI00397920BF
MHKGSGDGLAPGHGRIGSRSVGTIAIVVAILSVLWTAAADAQSYRFTSVSVEGAERVQPGTILSYAGIARGETVSAGELNAAYGRILDSGLFETVEIVPQGSRLVIRVAEYPTVNRIAFEGNRRIDDEALAELVGSQPRRIFNPSQAEADVATIVEAYEAQGRLAARVTPRVIERSDNRVDLVFEIFEGDLVEIERIGFVGNKAFSDRRLRRVLETKQAGILRAFIQSDTLVADRIEFDKQLLRDFYLSRGYVDFRTTSVNAELAQERDGYFVTFNVQEGQRFAFGRLSVDSDLPEVNLPLFRNAIRTRPGQTYSPSRIDNDIARLERLAIEQGLDFVRVEPQVTRNDRELTLDIEYRLVRGPRIFVERIDIEGNTSTLDRVIRRQFRIAEGDPFNPREIRESAERIRALGLFADAEVEAREGSSPEQVIVDVDVEEQPTGSLTFGGTYSTSGGFGALIRFEERNFLGRGQRLGLEVSSGLDNRVYSLRFTEPALLDRDLTFDLALSFRETERFLASYDTAIGRFRPSINFPVTDNSRLSLRYTAEISDLSDLADDAGAIIEDEAARGELWDSSVGYTFSYDTRRTGLDPNAGVLLEFGQNFGGVGGDNTFIETTTRALARTRVLNEEVILRAEFEGGMLNYTTGGSRVTDRYFLGPARMRGFTLDGIGPRERDPATGVDEALGGNMYAVARFEAEFPLGLPEEYNIRGGVFYDIGSVWDLDQTNDDVIYDDFSVRQTVGLSIFWDTPVGPLRFNFSEPIAKRRHDETQAFDLTLSTRF